MPMYWTFNCFLGFNISPSPPPKWLLNLEFWRPEKRGPSCPNWGQGGGFRGFGQCPKESVFFSTDVFPNLGNLDHFLRTHRSPITTLIINAMMTLVKIITMMNKDHKDHMKCQITWNINWHKLSNDMEYQMTWNLKWHKISNDMKPHMTWNLKWHEISYDMKSQMTWNLKWQKISNDMKSQMTQNLKWHEISNFPCKRHQQDW